MAAMELTKFERNVKCGEKQGISKPAMQARRIFEKGKDRDQAKGLELKISEVEQVDFIGVDKYDFHPRYQPGSFFSELRRIEKKHGLNFNEFYFSKEVKRRRHSMFVKSWLGGSNSTKCKFRQGFVFVPVNYSKCTVNFPSKAKVGREWLNQVMSGVDSRTNLLEEEGYDAILPSYEVHSIKKSWDARSFVDDQAFHGVLKDRAWKFKRKVSLKAYHGVLKDWAWKYRGKAMKIVPRVTTRFRVTPSFHGVCKDWAWKFKTNVRLKIANGVLNHAREVVVGVPAGPVTRSRMKKFKEGLNCMMRGVLEQAEAWKLVEGMEEHVQDFTIMIGASRNMEEQVSRTYDEDWSSKGKNSENHTVRPD